MPFRTAYYITKSVVAKANELSKDMSELTVDEIRASHTEVANIDEEVIEFLDLRNSMNARNSYGGTSTEQTKLQIENFRKEFLNVNV